MTIAQLQPYASAFIIVACTVMAGWIAYESRQVPDWYVAVIAAVSGYLFGKKEAEEANLVRSRGTGASVGSWVAKPVAKWIALAACAFVLGTVVPWINAQLGRVIDVGYGVTITINEEMTNWSTSKISNLVEMVTQYINKL